MTVLPEPLAVLTIKPGDKVIIVWPEASLADLQLYDQVTKDRFGPDAPILHIAGAVQAVHIKGEDDGNPSQPPSGLGTVQP